MNNIKFSAVEKQILKELLTILKNSKECERNYVTEEGLEFNGICYLVSMFRNQFKNIGDDDHFINKLFLVFKTINPFSKRAIYGYWFTFGKGGLEERYNFIAYTVEKYC